MTDATARELLEAAEAVVAYSGGPIDLEAHRRLQRATKAARAEVGQ